ncbi:2-succinyl-6-hydroxy-2,4-cyclohexadiene-1-carboxylate synthase [Thalassobacillus devorans]|uniref:2-succinyl-6-hydroxy-2, 4-cyclohexadiene-1-carboxylate synthase n=1 Tax=Thalassobacillus devorans TaxID=279813 RepID=A0ABQ1PJU6_9BACI|nr:alpha/beta hydrolase [Thalassobacillus devorans]NIK30115.1 pimeloyl-ACP methyl ester carboxylesterase [Thalassobacillus devorans]GGC98449.1 2-succinyl-6-hydroxy-2,4-cyclohexadiene-1-carboxylate synthase [Thalassobacillus devorans]
MLDYVLKTNDSTSEYVIFVHGIGGNSRIFYKQIKAFRKQFNVLSIHLPGHGKSPSTTSYSEKMTFQTVNEEIIALMNHLKIPKAHFVGISLGSMVIQSLISHFPERVRSTVLGGSIVRMNAISKGLLVFGESIKNFMPYHTLYKLFAQILMPRSNHKSGREAFVREAKKMKRKDFLAWYKVARHPKKTLEKIHRAAKVPKLYISGTQDHLCIKDVRKAVEKIEQARLVEIPECGHVCNIEQADKFNELAINFINKYRQKKKIQNSVAL